MHARRTQAPCIPRRMHGRGRWSVWTCVPGVRAEPPGPLLDAATQEEHFSLALDPEHERIPTFNSSTAARRAAMSLTVVRLTAWITSPGCSSPSHAGGPVRAAAATTTPDGTRRSGSRSLSGWVKVEAEDAEALDEMFFGTHHPGEPVRIVVALDDGHGNVERPSCRAGPAASRRRPSPGHRG